MPEQGMVGVRCLVSNPRPLSQGRILPCEISYDSLSLPKLKHQADKGFSLRLRPFGNMYCTAMYGYDCLPLVKLLLPCFINPRVQQRKLRIPVCVNREDE